MIIWIWLQCFLKYRNYCCNSHYDQHLHKDHTCLMGQVQLLQQWKKYMYLFHQSTGSRTSNNKWLLQDMTETLSMQLMLVWIIFMRKILLIAGMHCKIVVYNIFDSCMQVVSFFHLRIYHSLQKPIVCHSQWCLGYQWVCCVESLGLTVWNGCIYDCGLSTCWYSVCRSPLLVWLFSPTLFVDFWFLECERTYQIITAIIIKFRKTNTAVALTMAAIEMAPGWSAWSPAAV